MDDKKREEKIRQLYREHLKEEVARPELREEKKAFIKTYFDGSGPAFAWRPSLVFAVVAICAFGFLFAYLRQGKVGVSPHRTPQVVSSQESVVSAVPALRNRERLAGIPAPRVEVKRLTSRVGPTMVYQKIYQEVPMTIVWVFPNGGGT